MKNKVLLLFCLLLASTSGCSTVKLASANAETERDAAIAGGVTTLSNSQTQTAVNRSEAETKSFDNKSEPTIREAGLTGIYEFKGGNRANEIRVLQISGGIIKVSFLGNSEFESPAGPMANSGIIAARRIQLEADSKALLETKDAPDCLIFLTFKANRLEVKQNDNHCGFPNGVMADGNYRKTSDAAPTFDFDDESGVNQPDAILEKQSGNVQDDTATRVRFLAGENSAVVPGVISNGSAVTYLIGAAAEQTMDIKVIDGGANNDVVFDVIAPDGNRLGGDRMYDNWSRRLPKKGDYVVTVSAVESENTGFKLRVTIR